MSPRFAYFLPLVNPKINNFYEGVDNLLLTFFDVHTKNFDVKKKQFHSE